MSREIKFRGWDENTKKWLYSLGFLKHGNSKIIMILKDTEDGFMTTPVNPDTVGQYTGLKDKNGKDIYEGDVLKLDDDWEKYGAAAGINYEVKFIDGCFRMKSKNGLGRGYHLEDDSEFEIIGNIHENPELLA